MSGDLTVDDLSVSLDTALGVVRAVDGVTLAIPSGRTAGIVGESGSGKTMLSRAIMGLLPASAIVSGAVCLDGREITGLDARALACHHPLVEACHATTATVRVGGDDE